MNKCSYPEAVVRLLDSYRQVKRERKRDMRKKEKTGSVSAYMNQFGKYFRKNWQLYIIFLLPGLLLTLIFKYLPMLGIIIAFEEYSPFLGYFDSKWIGAYNFKRLFSSTEFLRLLVNTLKLSGYNLLWSFFPPIILALLLNRVRSAKIKRNAQLVFYLPYFISTIVLAGMIRLFFSPVGPINAIFGTSIDFMSESKWFRSLYIGSGIWQTIGWSSIIYTSTLAGVSQDLIEAAKIDGCSYWGIFTRIMIPLIKPAVVTGCIFSFMWRWDDFLSALLYINKTAMYPVSLALKLFCDPGSSSDYGAMFAMASLSILPSVLIFIFFQKYLVEGISTSGLKG